MKKRKIRITLSLVSLVLFVLWTVIVGSVDVMAIGPLGSSVGLAGMNGAFRDLIGVRWELYWLTDILGLVPILIALCYAAVGAYQLIRRRSLLLVDRRILSLGALYVVFGAVFLYFELIPLNFRPVLIDGVLEASYPSSTTLMCTTVVPSFLLDVRTRVAKKWIYTLIFVVSMLFLAFTVTARILSGVHWISDIIGGVLISLALLFGYSALLVCDR
jgi:undecaprenyl-diphosphatase